MPTVLKESHPIARKEHTCMLCGDEIKKGEKYYRQTCVYDAAPYEWTEHEECREIVNRLQMFKLLDYDDGLSQEVFAEIIYDYTFWNINQKTLLANFAKHHYTIRFV